MVGPIHIDPDFIPTSAEDWRACLGDPFWRIRSGQLYKIMVKGENDLSGHVLPFRPNRAQVDFLNALHYRNVILKARQLGFTTQIAILWLDHALFVPDQRCAIIAHTEGDAEVIFRDKVKFAYDNLPEPLREKFPLKKSAADEILFAHNNSSIRIAVSVRSGTVHRLHISEMGKIAKQFPGKAVEIVTGSLPAVPKTGIAVIESTAEGAEGEFYKIASRAQAIAEEGRYPTDSEWMFHFFPWFEEPGYQMDPAGVVISPKEHEYFDRVEAEMGCKLTLRQRAWYISKRDNDFGGDAEKMWQEMPSTPTECWQKSTEGTFYATQMSAARSQGRIGHVPHTSHVLVNTFWDIGAGDGTGIWFHQYVGTQHRFIKYIEGWGESLEHFVRQMRATGWLFGCHYLPHDADQKRQMAHVIGSPIDGLRELAPDWNWLIVPRIHDFTAGIRLTRQKFGEAWFDAEGCKDGLLHLSLYRKKWNTAQGAWSEEPEKLTGHSEAADAFRQWAQGFDPAHVRAHKPPQPGRPKPRRASGFTA